MIFGQVSKQNNIIEKKKEMKDLASRKKNLNVKKDTINADLAEIRKNKEKEVILD